MPTNDAIRIEKAQNGYILWETQPYRPEFAMQSCAATPFVFESQEALFKWMGEKFTISQS